MYTRKLRYGKGYAGKSGNKCWIARINGTDKQYGLDRTFLDPDNVKGEHFNRARTMVDFTWQLDAGLYEASESGERWIFFVFKHPRTGEWKGIRPDDLRLKAMLELMDGGMDAEEARLATKPAPIPATPQVAS